MPAPYHGSCACGAVSAVISGEPVNVRQCWCRQCRRVASGGASTNAMFLTSDVAISGTLASHIYIAASGNTLTQSFCPSCGTPVMAASSGRPHFRTLRVGFIDEPHGLAPAWAIWTDEAPAWAVIDPALERFPGQPPAPPMPGT